MIKVYINISDKRKLEFEDFLTENKFVYTYTQDFLTADLKLIEVGSTDSLQKLRSELQSDLSSFIVISSLTDEQNVLQLINDCNVHYLIGDNTKSFQREFSFCISSILNGPKLSKNFAFNNATLISESVINETKDIKDEIDRCIEAADLSDYFSSPVDFLKTIANELVMNAVFNAPHGNQGEASYKRRSRSTKFKLDGKEEVKLRVLSCSSGLILSVSDNFGTLDFNTIQEKLKRSAQVKKPDQEGEGSGLGLYLIFQYSNIVIFNVGVNKSTDVICVIEPTKRYKKYRERITSFFYNEGDSGE